MEFWLISRAEVATPPALAALAGAKSTSGGLEDGDGLRRGGHVGALAPRRSSRSAPGALAAASSSSFWVAQGRAMSQGMLQMSRQPS